MMPYLYALLLMAGLGVLGLVWRELAAYRRLVRAERVRQRKQATIEYLNTIRDQFFHLDARLTRLFGERPLVLTDLEPDLHREMAGLLARVEFFAVGVKAGVYDRDLAVNLGGGILLALFGRLHPKVTALRDHPATRRCGLELEALCQAIQEAHQAEAVEVGM